MSYGAVLVCYGEVLVVLWWVLVGSGGFWWVLVRYGAVLVCSGVFWWVLVSSGGFWRVLVRSGAVLVCSGGLLVGSGEFWWVLVQLWCSYVAFWWGSCGFW